MPTNNRPTYKELYELMDQRTAAILEEFHVFQKDEFTPVKNKVEKIWFYVTVGATLATILVEVVVQQIARAFTKSQ